MPTVTISRTKLLTRILTKEWFSYAPRERGFRFRRARRAAPAGPGKFIVAKAQGDRMKAYNVRPGDRAEIINSVNGLRGPSVGRRVRVYADSPAKSEYDAAYAERNNVRNDPHHYCPPSPYEKEHTVMGKIWPVQSLDGREFVSEFGATGSWADVPDQFLRKLLDDEPDTALEVTRELVLDAR